MVGSKWKSAGRYGHTDKRNIVGPLYLSVRWASGFDPKGRTLPPYKASVFGYTLETRFDTLPEAKEAAEKIALKWALATVEELKEGESNAT